ncbi:ketosynthase chain-length factor [Dactylosporangium vinaceum]|uniref:Ketosynthase chain-length factor n=1 Tax=Dactylosporangium vinaceum TaxID=53362 RepID=A0ABV5M368_9ACTN|nr:ketosynthase chain-length factor [Dactylosporangium vinaceum]UAB99763.1 ketosynthase chain-length factor [Dactylosporangium vinaceum]
MKALVTGLGVVAPNGIGGEAFWRSTLEGRSGVRPLAHLAAGEYPARLAGQISDFDVEAHLPGRLLPQTDRSTRLALVAADQALADAGVDPTQRLDYDMGVVTSNATGGFEFTHTEINKLWNLGPRHVSVYESFAWFYAVNTGQISIRHGLRGPGAVLVTEQAGGLDAVGHARRTLRKGATLSVTGGVESSFDPWGWVCHIAAGRLSTETDPARAYRPFTADHRGHVPGEGGAILVLEEATAARARGARLYGEIAGYAATFDPRPGSGRPPGLRRAAELALADAGLNPPDIDVVFADAAGDAALDQQEAEALAGLFGPGGVPVTAPKTLTGRLHAGGGPLDIVAALYTIRDGLIPPTFHVTEVAPQYRLDLVRGPHPRARTVRAALVLARGQGGFNAAIVVRAV